MRHLPFFAWLAGLLLAAQVPAQTITKRTISAPGTVDAIEVDAATATGVLLLPAGVPRDSDPPPYTFESQWLVTWYPDAPEAVEFAADLSLGNYYTVTEAEGGESTQNYTGIVHTIGGQASWNAATRTLSYRVPVGKPDDGRASSVRERAPVRCEGASSACDAFMQSSAALEGLRVKLQFDENITSFTGTVVASQYSGDGPTDARTDLLISAGGQLEKAP